MTVRFALLAGVSGVALGVAMANAAVNLPLGGYSENFDSMGTGTTAPAGWTSGALAGAGATLATEADVNANISAVVTLGSTVATSTDGGTIAKNILIGGLDRAMGSRASTVAGVFTQLDLTNNTGQPLSALDFSYTVMNFSMDQSGGFVDELYGYRFGYSTDGTTFTRLTALDGIPATDLVTPTTVSQTITFASPVANGGTMSFRFFDDNDNGSNWDVGHMITNVAVTVPEPTTLSALGIGALALLRRRHA